MLHDDVERRRNRRARADRDRDRRHDSSGGRDRRGAQVRRLDPRHAGDWDGWDDLPTRRPTQRDRRPVAIA